MKKNVLTLLVLLVAGAAAYQGGFLGARDPARVSQAPVAPPQTQNQETDRELSRLQQAIMNRESDVQVEGEGVVVKLLPDDLEGSRHQRILLSLAWGGTLLIAHNIDLAPRVEDVRKGDTLRFFGEFEWNEKGGVVHWTHHDPARRHVGGWLRHEGKTYQ